jgi:DNA invertase Pin-like site-specific DNA recombinase
MKCFVMKPRSEMKVAIYLRVSTAEQTTENQLPVLEKWVADRGHQLARVYSENESAWKSGHQHELARLKADAARRQFDIVLVWALDRLSREGAAAILNLVNTLKTYGIRVISYSEAWTEAPGEIGEILYAIAGWVARMESQRRSERTKAGLERARREGKPIGKRGKDKKPRKRSGYYRRWENDKKT